MTRGFRLILFGAGEAVSKGYLKGDFDLAMVARPRHAFNSANQDFLNTRFLEAVVEGDFERARQFLRQGANINARTAAGETALIWAARNGQVGMALMLVVEKASLDAQDPNGRTALFHASENGFYEIVRGLIDGGADVTIDDRDGKKPLDMAIKTGNADLVLLFEKPLLAILSRIPAADMTRGLLASNVLLDDLDPTGNGVLHWAAGAGQANVAQAFLDAGADARVPNKDGLTPAAVAKAAGQSEMASLFEAAQKRKPATLAPRPGQKPLFPPAQAF